MKTYQLALAAIVALGSTACGPSFTAATPPGFVELETDSYEPFDYRATTADGLVLGAREVENPDGATLEFWSRAVENQLRGRGGYAKLGQSKVKTNQGLEGDQLRFGFDQKNKPHLYTVTIFVTEDMVYVLEAGGPKPLVEHHEKQIAWAVRNFRH